MRKQASTPVPGNQGGRRPLGAVVQVSLTMSRCRAADSSSETVQTPKPVRGNREETKGCLLADVFDEDDNGNDHDNEHDEGDNDD
jgi:hypothetical protein